MRDINLRARLLVANYFNTHGEKTDRKTILSIDSIYVVSFAKTLQNWRALLSTTVPDGMYYEVTYNGDTKETFIDAYKRVDSIVIPD